MLYKTSTLVLVVIVAFVEVIVSQSAGVPHLLNFQGELTDPFSEPIDDPNLTVNFTFYDQPFGGSAL